MSASSKIAGNTRILTTVIAPTTPPLSVAAATEVFSIPIQSKPGWRRIGLDTESQAPLFGRSMKSRRKGSARACL